MVFVANLLVILALTVAGFGLKEVLETWGYTAYMSFCAGSLITTVIWQAAHKSRYGHWFEPPVISADASGDAAGAADVPRSADAMGESLRDGGNFPPRAIKS